MSLFVFAPNCFDSHWCDHTNTHLTPRYGRDPKGNWFTDIRAMTMYLTLVKQYPQYGGAFFDVQYKGYWTLPTRLLLSIDVNGFKFVHLATKDILKECVDTHTQLTRTRTLFRTFARTLTLVHSRLRTRAHGCIFVFVRYKYEQLESVAVNALEHTLTLNMKKGADANNFMFLCPRKDDVANMIASYSPPHRNWKQVSSSFRYFW